MINYIKSEWSYMLAGIVVGYLISEYITLKNGEETNSYNNTTRRAAVCAAVLELIERETLSGKEDI